MHMQYQCHVHRSCAFAFDQTDSSQGCTTFPLSVTGKGNRQVSSACHSSYCMSGRLQNGGQEGSRVGGKSDLWVAESLQALQL